MTPGLRPSATVIASHFFQVFYIGFALFPKSFTDHTQCFCCDAAIEFKTNNTTIQRSE